MVKLAQPGMAGLFRKIDSFLRRQGQGSPATQELRLPLQPCPGFSLSLSSLLPGSLYPRPWHSPTPTLGNQTLLPAEIKACLPESLRGRGHHLP